MDSVQLEFTTTLYLVHNLDAKAFEVTRDETVRLIFVSYLMQLTTFLEGRTFLTSPTYIFALGSLPHAQLVDSEKPVRLSDLGSSVFFQDLDVEGVSILQIYFFLCRVKNDYEQIAESDSQKSNSKIWKWLRFFSNASTGKVKMQREIFSVASYPMSVPSAELVNYPGLCNAALNTEKISVTYSVENESYIFRLSYETTCQSSSFPTVKPIHATISDVKTALSRTRPRLEQDELTVVESKNRRSCSTLNPVNFEMSARKFDRDCGKFGIAVLTGQEMVDAIVNLADSEVVESPDQEDCKSGASGNSLSRSSDSEIEIPQFPSLRKKQRVSKRDPAKKIKQLSKNQERESFELSKSPTNCQFVFGTPKANSDFSRNGRDPPM